MSKLKFAFGLASCSWHRYLTRVTFSTFFTFFILVIFYFLNVFVIINWTFFIYGLWQRSESVDRLLLHGRFGRRWPLFVFHMTTAVMLFVSIFVPEETGKQNAFLKVKVSQQLVVIKHNVRSIRWLKPSDRSIFDILTVIIIIIV